jgi:hypothetical protein
MVPEDENKGYFVSPKAPEWDSTPELYCDVRTTLYSLMNLIRIADHVEGDLKTQVEKVIRLTSTWIDARQWTYKNPYISALLLRYKMLLWGKTKTPQDLANLIIKAKEIDQQWRIWKFIIRNSTYKKIMWWIGIIILVLGYVFSS